MYALQNWHSEINLKFETKNPLTSRNYTLVYIYIFLGNVYIIYVFVHTYLNVQSVCVSVFVCDSITLT